MDIRTKLVLALVLVALSSMALLGAFAYQTTAGMLQKISVRQLNALAESRKDDAQNVVRSWKDKVSLVRSRTQLPFNLRSYIQSGDISSLSGIREILNDALGSVEVFERITIYAPDGAAVASVGESAVVTSFELPSDPEVEFAGSFPMADGGVHVALWSRLDLDGQIVGGVEVVLNASDLRSVVSDYTGLGDTGEVLMVMRENSEWLRVFHRLRHHQSEYERTRVEDASQGVLAALSAGSAPLAPSDFRFADYRGETVWGASRYIDGLAWGLVVKIDEAEEEQLADELRGSLIDLSLALSAFAVVGGTILGFWLARPVLRLREVIDQVRAGDLGIRADATGDDEIAYLAGALNDFFDQYQKMSGDTAVEYERTHTKQVPVDGLQGQKNT